MFRCCGSFCWQMATILWTSEQQTGRYLKLTRRLITGIVSCWDLPHRDDKKRGESDKPVAARWHISKDECFSSFFHCNNNNNSNTRVWLALDSLEWQLEKYSKLNISLLLCQCCVILPYKDKRTHKMCQRITLYNPNFVNLLCICEFVVNTFVEFVVIHRTQCTSHGNYPVTGFLCAWNNCRYNFACVCNSEK